MDFVDSSIHASIANYYDSVVCVSLYKAVVCLEILKVDLKVSV
jgi:hypothetical protein